MTYCVAVAVNAGMVFCSDSRTNAGVDQVSTYSKMHKFPLSDERHFVILSSGNLATTQGVITQLKRDIKDMAEVSLLNAETMHDVADYIGQISKVQQEKLTGGGSTFEVSFIIGGQIANSPHQVMMIYPQGNYITTSKDTPYLQIGESKYGKPIMDRIISPGTSLDTAALCCLVSMDSTMRSNITVGPPIEIQIYEANTFNFNQYYRFEENSDYLRELKQEWDAKLTEAFRQLRPIAWAAKRGISPDEQNEVSR